MSHKSAKKARRERSAAFEPETPFSLAVDRHSAERAAKAIELFGDPWLSIFKLWLRSDTDYLLMLTPDLETLRIKEPLAYAFDTEEALCKVFPDINKTIEDPYHMWAYFIEEGTAVDALIKETLRGRYGPLTPARLEALAAYKAPPVPSGLTDAELMAAVRQVDIETECDDSFRAELARRIRPPERATAFEVLATRNLLIVIHKALRPSMAALHKVYRQYVEHLPTVGGVQ
jgi:hypothetical protein